MQLTNPQFQRAPTPRSVEDTTCVGGYGAVEVKYLLRSGYGVRKRYTVCVGEENTGKYAGEQLFTTWRRSYAVEELVR